MLPPTRSLPAQERQRLTPEAVVALSRLQQEFRERMRVAYAFSLQATATTPTRAARLCAAYKQVGQLLDRPSEGVVRSLRTMAARPTSTPEIATVFTRLAAEIEALYGDKEKS